MQKKGFDMNTKLRAGDHEPVLVKTEYEKKAYFVGIFAAVAGLVAAVVIVWQWMEGKKLPDLGLRHSIPTVLAIFALLLLIVAGWLNLKAARAWYQKPDRRLNGGDADRGSRAHVGIVVGSKVRIKQNLTPEEKDAGPGWSSQMNLCLGRESVVRSINDHGRVILVDFPNYRFLQEWLELIE